MFKLQSPDPEWMGSIPSEDKQDPRPFLMPGIRMAFNPIDDEVYAESQAAYVEEKALSGPDGRAFARAADVLLRAGIATWEGLQGPDGKPAPVTPETIEQVIRDPRIRPNMVNVYVTPFLLWDAEGNASAGSPNGIGAKATPDTIIAASRAKRPKARAAKNARTASTPRKAPRAKASGN